MLSTWRNDSIPSTCFFKTQLLIRIQSDCEIILQTQTHTPGNPGLSGSEVTPPVLASDARRESPLWCRLSQLTLQTLLRCLPCAGAVTRCDLVSLSGGWGDTACQSNVFFIKTRDYKSAVHGLDVKPGCPEDLLGRSAPLLVTAPHPWCYSPRVFSHSWLMQSSVPPTSGVSKAWIFWTWTSMWAQLNHVHAAAYTQEALAESLMESNKNTTLTGKFFPVVDGKLFLSTALSSVSLIKNGNTNQSELGWRISAASLNRDKFSFETRASVCVRSLSSAL